MYFFCHKFQWISTILRLLYDTLKLQHYVTLNETHFTLNWKYMYFLDFFPQDTFLFFVSLHFSFS